MKSLEQMKKKQLEYIRKIDKIERDVKTMKAMGDSDDHWLVKMNLKWLKGAKHVLAQLNEDIKLMEMKQA